MQSFNLDADAFISIFFLPLGAGYSFWEADYMFNHSAYIRLKPKEILIEKPHRLWGIYQGALVVFSWSINQFLSSSLPGTAQLLRESLAGTEVLHVTSIKLSHPFFNIQLECVWGCKVFCISASYISCFHSHICDNQHLNWEFLGWDRASLEGAVLMGS